MIAQDTGSAIVGPARADIYFGAGEEAGRIAGRIKNPARFVMLMPSALDPVEAGRQMPLPEPRPASAPKAQPGRGAAGRSRAARQAAGRAGSAAASAAEVVRPPARHSPTTSACSGARSRAASRR